MVAGSVAAVILGAVQLTESARIHQPLDSEGSLAAPPYVIQALLFLVAAFLSLWMAWKNRQGRVWARNLTIVAGILVIVAAATVFLTFGGRLTAVASFSYGVSAILSASVLALIWRKESYNFYATDSHRKSDPDDELPPHDGPVALGTFSADESQ
jgi:O-antigen/teichoic acid export membrane protein